MLRFIAYLSLLIPSLLWGVEYDELNSYLQTHPFSYDLGLHTIEGQNKDSEVIICCHGYGGTETLTKTLHSYRLIPHHLVGFRFPDYGKITFIRSPHETHFGSIQELLPLLYLVKRLAVDAGVDKIHLYGFSAGGGAIINTLAVLSQNRFPDELSSLGILENERNMILAAVEKGMTTLDCPLKSIDEILDFRGSNQQLEIIAERYARNDLRPIDSLNQLSALKLNILLHFQNPDEVIDNRDDTLYIKRLREANRVGQTHVVIGHDGGHMTYHKSLWTTYKALQQQK